MAISALDLKLTDTVVAKFNVVHGGCAVRRWRGGLVVAVEALDVGLARPQPRMGNVSLIGTPSDLKYAVCL